MPGLLCPPVTFLIQASVSPHLDYGTFATINSSSESTTSSLGICRCQQLIGVLIPFPKVTQPMGGRVQFSQA